MASRKSWSRVQVSGSANTGALWKIGTEKANFRKLYTSVEILPIMASRKSWSRVQISGSANTGALWKIETERANFCKLYTAFIKTFMFIGYKRPVQREMNRVVNWT